MWWFAPAAALYRRQGPTINTGMGRTAVQKCSQSFLHAKKAKELVKKDRFISFNMSIQKKKKGKRYQMCVFWYIYTCMLLTYLSETWKQVAQPADGTPMWGGLTNSSRLQAPATLTSVARGCGEAGRAHGACLLASTGRPASKLMHNTHTHSLVLR